MDRKRKLISFRSSFIFIIKKKLRPTMKRLIYSLFAVAVLAITMTSCEECLETELLEVRFENVSTYDLENVEVPPEMIGDLKAGERTDYQIFEHISMSQGRPSTSISAMIGEVELRNNNYQIMMCGIGWDEDDLKSMQLQPGKYTITIDVEEAKAEQNISNKLYIDIRED